MPTAIRITPGLPPAVPQIEAERRRSKRADWFLKIAVITAFGAVGVQATLLGVVRQPRISLAIAEPVATSFSRPDIVDRKGHLLATDIAVPSLYADPAYVVDRDDTVEQLATVFPDLDQNELRRLLSDRSRRFTWIRRGLSPATAQRVHDLGLPGLAFRDELRRAYPAGRLAGYVLGGVNIDNRGVNGVEKYVDDAVGVDPVHGAVVSEKAPVRLSLDISVQHSVEDELDTAIRRYKADAAAGLVLDIATGEVIASASLPQTDPSRLATGLLSEATDRIAGGTYELGSVFKTLTIAMALDSGLAKSSTIFDVREPLTAGRFTISDYHPAGRPLSVAEIFTHSSNVGAGMLALQAGPEAMQAFMTRAGLLTPLKTEAGPVSPPQIPAQWGRAETITVSYGHGLAVAPIQFAVAAAAVLNGGRKVTPTFLKNRTELSARGPSLVSPATSKEMARLLRLNVMDAEGTGKRADVPGYRVGGKTGTAEIPVRGGYRERAVVSSFLGAFPMDQPRYLTFVLLFEPQGTVETNGQRTASTNAAPVTARIVGRIAAQLGVEPQITAAAAP